MRAFTGPYSQRVRVIDREHPMFGTTGTTSRRRISDSGAWVAMDVDPPDEVRAFPSHDEHGRGRHVLLYPDQCEAA